MLEEVREYEGEEVEEASKPCGSELVGEAVRVPVVDLVPVPEGVGSV